MKQILIIHGGDSFSSYDAYLADLRNAPIDYERLKSRQRWKDWIASQFPDDDVLTPTFPNSSNAQYSEWKIMFEKILPFIEADCVLIGHSLGGSFLMKYLSECGLPFVADTILFVATPYPTTESLASFASTPPPQLLTQAKQVHFLHSKDDLVVPFSDFESFKTQYPQAVFHAFENKFHFIDSTFPELVEIIKK